MAHAHDTQGHNHDHGRVVERALWIAFGLNAAFLVVELVVGLLADSLALLSDAGHMVSDVAALGMALVAQRLARSQAGPGFTFGLRRVPVLGAFGNALSLLIIAALILWEAWHRLQAPPAVMAWPVLVAGTAGLAVNLISAWVLHRGSDQSLNVRGAMLHLLADALGSVGAIVAAVVLLTTGWAPIDAIVSVVIALLLLVSTWPLLRDSTKVLLQGAPAGVEPEHLRALLCDHPAVERVADLHVWQIDVGQSVLTAALVTRRCELIELEQIAVGLKAKLLDEQGIQHVTLEWCTDDGAVNCSFERPAAEPHNHD